MAVMVLNEDRGVLQQIEMRMAVILVKEKEIVTGCTVLRDFRQCTIL